MTKEAVGSIWNMSADLGNGRQISVSWNMDQGADLTAMNAGSDLYRQVLDRQQAKSAIVGLEQEIDRLAGQKKQVIDTMNRLDNKTESKGGASVAERGQRDAALQNLDSLSTNIDSKQKLLQKLVAEAK